ncbi:MAG: hypothetical protein WDO15_22135 [Bacteroidota bacterium]
MVSGMKLPSTQPFLIVFALRGSIILSLKHPELRIVSNGQVEKIEEELQALIDQKENIGAENLAHACT